MKKLALLLGIVLSLLLGHGLVGTQPSYAIDCEVERFNDFMDANAQYTSTFRSWYFDEPLSCQQECTATCDQISDPNARQTCMNNLSNCISNCDASRYNSYTSAQDNLMAVASRPCSYNPDQCGEARWRRDLCNAAYNAHWGNPVYDGNGNIDGNWMFYVFQEYMACRAASGIDNCE
jgi:hypothetical protein